MSTKCEPIIQVVPQVCQVVPQDTNRVAYTNVIRMLHKKFSSGDEL